MVKATIRVDNEVLTSECKAALVVSIEPTEEKGAASSLMLAGETNVMQVIGETASAIGGYIRQMGKGDAGVDLLYKAFKKSLKKAVKGQAGTYRVEKDIAIPVEK